MKRFNRGDPIIKILTLNGQKVYQEGFVIGVCQSLKTNKVEYICETITGMLFFVAEENLLPQKEQAPLCYPNPKGQ